MIILVHGSSAVQVMWHGHYFIYQICHCYWPIIKSRMVKSKIIWTLFVWWNLKKTSTQFFYKHLRRQQQQTHFLEIHFHSHWQFSYIVIQMKWQTEHIFCFILKRKGIIKNQIYTSKYNWLNSKLTLIYWHWIVYSADSPRFIVFHDSLLIYCIFFVLK